MRRRQPTHPPEQCQQTVTAGAWSNLGKDLFLPPPKNRRASPPAPPGRRHTLEQPQNNPQIDTPTAPIYTRPTCQIK
ncbi:uncharacterized protein METZ01_LOCUS187514 [marine metagenome]|uniref:Uncharacterized protein n=1 Tax=marine metagenome TaxID=408172 RepID=A0A382D8A8_9ZZZZ